MSEFWEEAFKNKQEMWGSEPALSTLITADYFSNSGINKVLIPGFGYGRNAKSFLDKGMQVTGIEISQTAITLAKQNFGDTVPIYHGSVCAMPFDQESYEGIYCYGLIYLLDAAERKKLIADCYAQLANHGAMVFTVISKNASTYGQGTLIGEDQYEQFGGVRIFFYDRASIASEFESYGLVEVIEVQENYPFYLIKCEKKDV